MMVGILAYLLPSVPQQSELWPAIGGAVLALCGWLTMHRDTWRKHLMHINALVALLLFVWAALKTPKDLASYHGQNIHFLADVDVLLLTGVFLYFAIKSFIDARRKRESKN